MPYISVDIGSFAMKVVKRLNGSETQFSDLSIVAPLDMATWEAAVRRNGAPPEGYIMHNGKPYALGRMARRHTVPNAVRGEARYRAGWYDVAFAYALSEVLQRSTPNLSVMLMHPPKDAAYADDILRLAAQRHEVETRHGKMRFDILPKATFVLDEPLCGYAHFVLKADGAPYVESPIKSKGGRQTSTLLLDVGGNTTDAVAVDQAGSDINVDYDSLESGIVGTIKILAEFERTLRARYKPEFQDAVDYLDPMRLDQALRTGSYPYGKRELPCDDLADEVLRPLAADVVGVINRMGGVAAYDNIIMIGGGAPLVERFVREALPDAEIKVEKSNTARWVNAYGGVKALRALMSGA